MCVEAVSDVVQYAPFPPIQMMRGPWVVDHVVSLVTCLAVCLTCLNALVVN